MHTAENLGGGSSSIYLNIPKGGGGHGFEDKIGSVHYFGFYCIFINKYF
jgi:hypothetical protein